MLIDELMSDPVLAQVGMLSPTLRGRLSKAPKFDLQREFAIAADEYSTRTDLTAAVDNLNKALPLARLPFNECWFEVAQADRHMFSAGSRDEYDASLLRVGFFCTQLDDQGSWSAQMFWSFAATEIEPITGHRLSPLPRYHVDCQPASE